MELKALAGQQLILEEEIQVKSNSIYIDEVICRQLRETVSIHNYWTELRYTATELQILICVLEEKHHRNVKISF